MKSVEIPDPGRSSLLTLMLKRLLERNLQDPGKAGVTSARGLTVWVRTRRMETTLLFDTNGVRAEDGSRGRPDLVISGELPALLSLALGANVLGAVLSRRLRVRPRSWRGLFRARKLMHLVRVG